MSFTYLVFWKWCTRMKYLVKSKCEPTLELVACAFWLDAHFLLAEIWEGFCESRRKKFCWELYFDLDSYKEPLLTCGEKQGRRNTVLFIAAVENTSKLCSCECFFSMNGRNGWSLPPVSQTASWHAISGRRRKQRKDKLNTGKIHVLVRASTIISSSRRGSFLAASVNRTQALWESRKQDLPVKLIVQKSFWTKLHPLLLIIRPEAELTLRQISAYLPTSGLQ